MCAYFGTWFACFRPSTTEALPIPDEELDPYTAVVSEAVDASVDTGKLDLSDMLLGKLPPRACAVKSVTSCNVCGNELDALELPLAWRASLQALFAYSNMLAEVPDVTTFASLRVLRLSANHITHVPASLARLTGLEELSLARNELTELPETLPPRLRVLWLHDNAITHLPRSMCGLTDLREVSLDRNQLTSLMPLAGVARGLTFLSFQGNLVHEVPYELVVMLHDMSERSWMRNQCISSRMVRPPLHSRMDVEHTLEWAVPMMNEMLTVGEFRNVSCMRLLATGARGE